LPHAAKCSICGGEAVYYSPLTRQHLCAGHFTSYFRGRVGLVVDRYRLLDRVSSVVVLAASGGKDSAAAADVLSWLAGRRGLRLLLVHVDVGVPGFSDASRRAVEELGGFLGAPAAVLSLRDAVGMAVHELARRARRPVCSVCGLVKRYFINAACLAAGESIVFTGHNMDDMATYAFKNFIMQDLAAIRKLVPCTEPVDGLAAGRARPLYETPEREAELYVRLRGVPYTAEECSFKPHSTLDEAIRRAVRLIDGEKPGTILSMMRRLASSARQYPEPSYPVKPCRFCGALSSRGECSFCRLTRRVLGEPMGARVRDYVKDVVAEALGGGGAS